MIRRQAGRPAGQRLPVTVRKTTINAPPTVSRQAATEIADKPVARLSRLPVRPPVPHNSPDMTRYSRPVAGRRRAAADPEVNARIENRSSDEKGNGRGSGADRNHPGGEHELARAREARVSPLTGLGARGLSPR